MSNVPKDVSEKQFQQDFVKEMQKFKWEAPDNLNGNIQEVTVKDLIDNWRYQLNRINVDQLEGVELTDNEFNQILSKVKKISNSYEAAKILSMENGIGKIDGIFRDDNPQITCKQITLTIFKKAQVSGGDSSYQIAREVKTDHNNRFDLVLLINGLPLINIEQKRTDKNLDEAFGQFKRYYRDGEYQNNFMSFSQMMVIISEIETQYFATPKSLDDFNLSFVFHWSDHQNKIIAEWHQVIKNFLMIPMAHQMVGDYLIIDEASDEENRRHMLMRPYQVHALQAIEGAALGRDGKCGGAPHGGFIWHTTGSGKTITSFKTALFLSTRLSFDKVVFMVDRKELDSNTAEKFKAYSIYEPVDVAATASTSQLRGKLQSNRSGIIVTTTFKLANLVKELKENNDWELAEKRIVFIVDEAQRTTMGKMMGMIKHYFRKNGLFYGFTGTPLFEENKVKGMIIERYDKSELINTTEKLFGPELHRYTIDEAISDGNVLGFNVDYINTGEFNSYEDLKEQLIEKFDKPASREQQRKIRKLSDLEVEKKAIEEGLLVYQDETHIPRVVEEILTNWEEQSQRKNFNAILTVAYKERVIAYYKEFRKQLSKKNQQLNIAMTFSFGNENDPESTDLDEVKKMMFEDYSEFTGVNFTVGDKSHGEEAYFEDLIERTKRGGSGRNPKNIDLVIVADQLLTGYDSKRLNTLYVDRNLELQSLIQAYSRTNRILGATKEFGSIVNFQYPKITEESVNNALKLYGSGGESSQVIVDNYDVAVSKLRQKINDMLVILKNPTEWFNLKNNEEECKKFKLAYLDVNRQLNRVGQYYCFRWDEISFGISEHEMMKYQGAYTNLMRGKNEQPPEELTIRVLQSKTKLQGSQVIDAQHILNLIGEKVDTDGNSQTVNEEVLRIVYEQIQELSDMGNDQQAQFLRRFVDEELIPGNVSSDIQFDTAFKGWKNKLLQQEVEEFASDWGVDGSLVLESLSKYIPEKAVIPDSDIIIKSASYDQATNKNAGNQLHHVIKLSKILPKWVLEISKKYK